MVEVKTPCVILATVTALFTARATPCIHGSVVSIYDVYSDLLTPVVAILGIPTFVILLLILLAFHRVFEGNL